MLPSHFTHDLSTLFALPSWYDCFPHTSAMVWELPSQLADSLKTSLTLPLLSECFPAFFSWSKDFSHTALKVWGLPSHFPHGFSASRYIWIWARYQFDKRKISMNLQLHGPVLCLFNSSCYFDKGVVFIFHTLNHEHLGHHDRHLCASSPAIRCKMSIISFIT